MSITKRIPNVYHVFPLGQFVVINYGNRLEAGNKVLEIESMNGYRNSNDFLSLVFDGRIDIYDSKLSLIHTIHDGKISIESTGVQVLNKDTFVVFYASELTSAKVYSTNGVISETDNFWGKFLDFDCRLNFKEWAFDEINYFRCSNILDNETYFEYQCLPQENILPSIFKWKDKIVFTLLRKGKFLLTFLNYLSGEKVWEQEIPHSDFCVNLDRGLLVSVWGNNQPGNYQIVNLNQNKIESGIPSNEVFFHNAQTPRHLDLLFGNHFYFADNRDSYAGEQENVVKVGFLNIVDKQIEFIHEFHESPTSPLSEIVEHNGKLYVRNADDELFIIEV